MRPFREEKPLMCTPHIVRWRALRPSPPECPTVYGAKYCRGTPLTIYARAPVGQARHLELRRICGAASILRGARLRHCREVKQEVCKSYRLADQGWSGTERKALESCKRALENQVWLPHRDLSQKLCVYTDPSDLAWSSVVAKVPSKSTLLLQKYQRHLPISFLYGR